MPINVKASSRRPVHVHPQRPASQPPRGSSIGQEPTNSGEGSFLLHLRTKLYNDLHRDFHANYDFPEQRFALEEKPFRITVKGHPNRGISMCHQGTTTNIKTLDDSVESYYLLAKAACCLARANEAKHVINGTSTASQYELSFDLYVDTLEEIENMLRMIEGSIEIENFYYSDGRKVDDADIHAIKQRIGNEPSVAHQNVPPNQAGIVEIDENAKTVRAPRPSRVSSSRRSKA